MLNIPVPAKTRERLDRLKASTGAKSYTKVARDAFLVFAQLIENRKQVFSGAEDSEGQKGDIDDHNVIVTSISSERRGRDVSAFL